MVTDNRNYGLDLFRIMCCLGVLDYHIVDDILGVGGGSTKAVYYLASFCVPGFFLLSGYLLGCKESLSIEYCEHKVKETAVKYFGWIIFWTVVHFARTGEVWNIWDHALAGAAAGGILPVAWFLFTYCILILLSYPLFYFKQTLPHCFHSLALAAVTALAFGAGKGIIYSMPQSLWFHLYFGYFVIGMALPQLKKFFDRHIEIRMLRIIFALSAIVCAVIYGMHFENPNLKFFPHEYYGSWFYSIWLISLFMLCAAVNITNGKVKSIIKRLSDNTFAVYLGHLPVLLFLTDRRPVENIWGAVWYVVLLFAGLQMLVELFRKMPLLRKLV